MKNIFIQSRICFVGIILVIISAILHFFAQFITNGAEFAIFCVNYLLTACYWLYSVFLALFRRKKFRFNSVFPALVLALISAYALNRSMNVFDASPVWFSVVLVLVSIACLALEYFDRMNNLLKISTLFLVGIGMSVFLYLAIYLTPIYPISVALFLGLGLSLHSFVPLLFCIFIILWITRYLHKQKTAVIAFGSGIATVAAIVLIFSLQWTNTVNQINKTYHDSFIEDEVQLPSWVRVAQRIDKNAITNKILKVGLTYKDINRDAFDWWDMDFDFGNRFTEPKIHDPLVLTASLFSEQLRLSRNDKIKILESIYDSRHQATERLWSDEKLHTTYINSSVLLYPQYRIAYTEQVMAVRNASQYEWNRGEAVYTFHLPEGSVATSLSLWINGQEEKAILTSKNKAENAYRTIVGVERRDPSLVVWKEGNRLTVRIFPVTGKEERVFKIGITSPLKLKENNLVYEPVYFDGPEYSNAKSEISVKMMQPAENLHCPKFLHETAAGFATNQEVKYAPLWNISMSAPELSKNSFCFTTTGTDINTLYSVDYINYTPMAIDVERVYLDINNSWTKEDFNAVWDMVKGKDVRIFNGTNIEKADKNKKDFWFDELHKLQFSLFPLHLISKPESSLLISKSASVSPNIEDLKDSRFLDSLKQKMTPEKAVLFYNAGENLSPYLKTMKEFRLLRYCSGSIENLGQSIQKSEFRLAQEDDNHIVIYDANICISRYESTPFKSEPADAPDHLMRLFAYNHILAEYSQSWNTEESPFIDSIVEEATQAYVVSPVSSLVVLEKKADYERFDIEAAENSLKNASKSSPDAAPIGDGIWFLVVLAIGCCVCQFYYNKYQQLN